MKKRVIGSLLVLALSSNLFANQTETTTNALKEGQSTYIYNLESAILKAIDKFQAQQNQINVLQEEQSALKKQVSLQNETIAKLENVVTQPKLNKATTVPAQTYKMSEENRQKIQKFLEDK